MLHKIRAEIKELKKAMQRLKPAQAPGTLTSQTTRGVARQATAKTSEGTVTDSVPRWG